ncbi:hypothetical protein BXT86_05810 [candidate division WOR-3 bacterium 4484_100]|uniref:Rad50/SbcC-type AAA domain-containing protein n=1 Tax=candidate division WOR-3 bacterium 4484_100 TaxID=1936077 RepID=A0A1V4QE00_UNCW3|nr:MAG: hypothetical protein BXT86_05810 [candidate division WOR-3 bacterium 4484_100]
MIYGLNESGKTALIEALGWLLFRRSIKDLRYDRPLDIEIIIEDAGHTYSLPAKKIKFRLPVGNIAGLLYVRASESAVFDKKSQDSFWDSIKTMLGRIGKGIPFTKLDKKIFDEVGLQFKKKGWNENKTRIIQQERERLRNLKDYLEQIGKIEDKEVCQSRLKDRYTFLKNRLSKIEMAKRYKNYKELKNLYGLYLETKSRYQDYDRYKYDYQTRWQKLLIERESLIKAEENRKRTIEEIDVLKQEIDKLTEKDDMISAQGLEESIRTLPGKTEGWDIRYSGLILSITTILFLISFFLPIPKIISIFLFLLGLAQFVFSLYQRKKVQDIDRQRSELLDRAKAVFPEVDNLDQFYEKVRDLHEQRMKREAMLQEKERVLKLFGDPRDIDKIENEIEELRKKTGLAEIDDLDEKIREKKLLDDKLARIKANIAERLNEGDENRWMRMIESMKTEPPEEEVDVEQEDEVKAEIERIGQRIQEMERDIRVFRAVQKSTYNVTDDHSAFLEYHQLRKRLEDYDLERQAAIKAREILIEMSSELDQFIEDIISGDEGLNRYFHLVTGRYDRVEVVDKDFVAYEKTRKFQIKGLSSGTRDQLLLCFRIAALKRLYPQGFFLLLDDAFIFADWVRREKLVRLLKDCADKGNQIIYLTSDNHTRDLFRQFGARITEL